MSTAPPALSREALYRMQQALAHPELRPAPWTPALTLALNGTERELVVHAREWLPTLVANQLRLLREANAMRTRIAELQARAAEGAAA